MAVEILENDDFRLVVEDVSGLKWFLLFNLSKKPTDNLVNIKEASVRGEFEVYKDYIVNLSKNLDIALSSISLETRNDNNADRKKIDYIDLRFNDKVFYKFKN